MTGVGYWKNLSPPSPNTQHPAPAQTPAILSTHPPSSAPTRHPEHPPAILRLSKDERRSIYRQRHHRSLSRRHNPTTIASSHPRNPLSPRHPCFRTLDSGKITHFVLDGQSVVQERTAIGNDTTTTTYLVGPRGPEISLQDDGTNESIRWYVYDGLGSVIAEVGDADTSNNNPVKSIRTYNVFGGEHSSDQLSGETPSKHKFVGSLGHTSDDTGLIYMRARYYDPSVGRFISQDAKAIGGNWYAYCCNDPLDDVDADGNIPMSPDEARATVECGYGLSLIGAFCFIEIDPWLWATGMSLIIAGAGMMAVGMMANTEANHNPVFNAMLLPLVGAISSIAAGRALLGVENPVQAYVISYVVSVTVYTAVALIS